MCSWAFVLRAEGILSLHAELPSRLYFAVAARVSLGGGEWGMIATRTRPRMISIGREWRAGQVPRVSPLVGEVGLGIGVSVHQLLHQPVTSAGEERGTY